MWVIYTIVGLALCYIFYKEKYKHLEKEILRKLRFTNWNVVPYYDKCVTVKSRQTLEKYDAVKFFKENKDELSRAEWIVNRKSDIAKMLREFLNSNEFESRFLYNEVKRQIDEVLENSLAYRIEVKYITRAGNHLASKRIALTKIQIDNFTNDPSLLMSKTEFNKYVKEQQKATLDKKHHEYYEKVNRIIDYANNQKDSLVVKEDRDELDKLITQLFDRTVNSIKKIKTIDSEEWDVIDIFIGQINDNVKEIVNKNQKISQYYKSSDFLKIKDTCETLMSSQREFNEYIDEKVQSISKLFGSRTIRTETTNTDVNNYIRPYKKTITPFTAEVSAAVFASAENSPLEYVVKYFYPNKKSYPEQIQKLYLLVEELETLKDAKKIIENYKAEYQQYIGDVPKFVMENDESGFYSRLGFANIDEGTLTVEYKFSYTSGGGLAQRSFTVPMTEETIVELIGVLEGKLTTSAFTKEQRRLMTKKLRESIKKRDHYTCCNCGNSVYAEPNLLLEIDHIIPVSKGGCTEEKNLQTLCWKCNRSKSNKIVTVE